MKLPHYHLAGVGGVGMSALAQVLLARGATVSGSDRFLDQGRSLGVLLKLKAAGVRLSPQDGSGLTPEATALIYSTAVEKDNPDWMAAERLGVPKIHRAEMLAQSVEGKICVAVTGTAGKTTVTGMIGWLLQGVGRDPSVVNGGAVLNWKTDRAIGNVRMGASATWVVEADESDRSLLNFHPDWAVVTNISKDHFELAEVRDLFRAFAAQVKTGMVCGPGVAETLRTAVAPGGIEWVEASDAIVKRGEYFGFTRNGVDFTVPLPGRHNALNACAAVALCERMGIKTADLVDGIRTFKGIERRLERVDNGGDIAVIDDYAHNPEKIRAAWAAVALSHRRVAAVWRPHGYGPLAAMQNELASAIAGVCRPEDRFYVLPVFYAGGTATKTFTTEQWVERLKAASLSAQAVNSYDDLEGELARFAQKGDAILIMGARDPELPVFAEKLALRINPPTR